MQVDCIIVGQGLCGTWLSYYLEKAGASFIVIDKSETLTASRAASGIINPVTGRRIVTTWMIDELMPHAWEAYNAYGQWLGISCIEQKAIADFFATPQMRLAFLERLEKDATYLSLPTDENDWQDWLQYDFGYGLITPAYLIDIRKLLDQRRSNLQQSGRLRVEQFEFEDIEESTKCIRYKDLQTNQIIFCDGAAGINNPFFPNLPFGLNKGEAMLVKIPGLPATHILKKGYNLVPWSDDTFWLGSTYLWEFDDPNPTEGFRQFATNWLKATIKLPFEILDHWAAVRPATLERKPFVGRHPNHPSIAIFNGMGTKGCSLAPFFARQLTDHLLHGTPISPEASVQRFQRALNR